jgi:hypothetical protein
MALTMYQAAVPTCVRSLGNLAGILEKAVPYAQARKIEQSVLLNSRLFPDMLPLTTQILLASNAAAGGTARLAGTDVPAMEEAKDTFDGMIAGLRRSIARIEALRPEQFSGAEDRTISWQTRTTSKSMQGTPYLFTHLLPNLFFHVTTAYDILRHSGLEIGKQDYLGNT